MPPKEIDEKPEEEVKIDKDAEKKARRAAASRANAAKARAVRSMNATAKLEAKLALQKAKLAPVREKLPEEDDDEPEPVAELAESDDEEAVELQLVKAVPKRAPKRVRERPPSRAEKQAAAPDDWQEKLQEAVTSAFAAQPKPQRTVPAKAAPKRSTFGFIKF